MNPARDAEKRMRAAVDSTARALAGMRGGRASPAMVASVRVRAYGSDTPLEHVAQVGVPGPRTLVVTPHDPGLVDDVERALRDAGLGAQPTRQGPRLRLDLPAPTEERRRELARAARQQAEQGRVAVRTARKDGINAVRRAAKADDYTEAKRVGRERAIQRLSDEHVARVDELLAGVLAELE